MTDVIRRFRAQATHAEAHAYAIEAASFEEAAVAYVARWAVAEGECRVTVQDPAPGERHCFSLGLDGAIEEGC